MREKRSGVDEEAQICQRVVKRQSIICTIFVISRKKLFLVVC